MATESLSSKNPVVEVNSELVLEITNTRQPSPFPDFCPQSLWESLKWDERLAFKLLHLKHIDKTSPLMPWILTLPSSFSTPFTWKDEDLEDLQYSSLKDKVLSQRTKWKTLYQQWSQSASQSYPRDISYSEMTWALQCINSRAFSGPYEGSSPSERRALLAFTGFLTTVWPLLGLGTLEQALSAAFIVTLSIFLRDIISLRASSLKRYVVCPYVDMFNHKSNCISDASYNYFTGKFQLFTGDYQPNDQVFVSYGKQSNDRLFQYYGFIEPDNPHDIYEFDCAFIELMFKYADELSTAIPLPQIPDPKSRLQYISNALRKTNIQNIEDASASQSVISAADFKCRISARSSASEKTTCCFDDVTIRCMRAFFCSDIEWKTISAGLLESLKGLEQPLSQDTESKVLSALSALARLELKSFPTTIDEDLRRLKALDEPVELSTKGFSKVPAAETRNSGNEAPTVTDPSGSFKDTEYSKICFRIEKKKLLRCASEC